MEMTNLPRKMLCFLMAFVLFLGVMPNIAFASIEERQDGLRVINASFLDESITSNGDVIADVTVKNEGGKPALVKAYIVYYNASGNVKDVASASKTIPAQSEDFIRVSLYIGEAVEGEKAKLLVWKENDSALDPLIYPVTIYYNGDGEEYKYPIVEETDYNFGTILGIIKKANSAWQSRNSYNQRAFWDHAAYHTGNMEAYFLTGNETYREYSTNWAERNEWKGAKSDDKSKWKYGYGESDEYVLFGDWQICFQTYIDLNIMDPSEEKVARALEVMGYQTKETDNNDYWWWADGLYMVMPVMTRMYLLTGEHIYLDKLYEYYMYARDLMFDDEYKLFYRDGNYVYPKNPTPNGLKNFWSRGNGWVFAGLAKVLQDVPTDWEHRDLFLQDFRDMAATLKEYQLPEGYWVQSIIDHDYVKGYETSGSAFFTYGMLWGINAGVLDKDEYLETALKGIDYLVNIALQPNGSVGYVQPIGSAPTQAVTKDHVYNFGTGAFLLALSEMARFVGVDERAVYSVPNLRKKLFGQAAFVLGSKYIFTDEGLIELSENEKPAIINGSIYVPAKILDYLTIDDKESEPITEYLQGNKVKLSDVLEKLNKKLYQKGSLYVISHKTNPFYDSIDGYLTDLLTNIIKTGQLPENENLYPSKEEYPQNTIYVGSKFSRASDGSDGTYNATDANIDTAWSTTLNETKYIELYLGEGKEFNRIDISFEGNSRYKTAFEIIASEDGKTWQTLVEKRYSSIINENEYESFYFDVTHAKYVRIVASPNSGANTFGIKDIRIYEYSYPDGSGFPPTKVYFAKESSSAMDESLAPAYYATDTNLKTAWKTEILGDYTEINFVLPRLMAVTNLKVRFLNQDKYISEFEVQVKTEDNSWVTAIPRGNSKVLSQNEDYEEFAFDTIIGKELKIIGYGSSNPSNPKLFGVCEVTLDYDFDKEEDLTGKIVLTPEMIYVTEEPEPQNNKNNLVDGDLNTRWSAESYYRVTVIQTIPSWPWGGGGGRPREVTFNSNVIPDDAIAVDDSHIQYMIIDLGRQVPIDKLGLAFYQGSSRKTYFSVDYSLDGDEWETIMPRTESSGTTNDFEYIDFNNVTARYIKVTGYGNSTNFWFSITEVEVYKEL